MKALQQKHNKEQRIKPTPLPSLDEEEERRILKFLSDGAQREANNHTFSTKR